MDDFADMGDQLSSYLCPPRFYGMDEKVNPYEEDGSAFFLGFSRGVSRLLNFTQCTYSRSKTLEKRSSHFWPYSVLFFTPLDPTARIYSKNSPIWDSRF